MNWPIAGVRAGKEDDGSSLPTDVPGAPPYKGHRWLPLPDNEKNIYNTPMIESSYDPNGPDWGSWSLGAQAHYSFLENLEKDELSRYHYGWGMDPDREAIWHMMYQRMNINFMAIWGKDVLDNLPFETLDDELALSVTVPLKLRRRKSFLPTSRSVEIDTVLKLSLSTRKPLQHILPSGLKLKCTILIYWIDTVLTPMRGSVHRITKYPTPKTPAKNKSFMALFDHTISRRSSTFEGYPGTDRCVTPAHSVDLVADHKCL